MRVRRGNRDDTGGHIRAAGGTETSSEYIRLRTAVAVRRATACSRLLFVRQVSQPCADHAAWAETMPMTGFVATDLLVHSWIRATVSAYPSGSPICGRISQSFSRPTNPGNSSGHQVADGSRHTISLR